MLFRSIRHLDKNLDLAVSRISDYSGKGRHTTTNRELFVLNSGGIVIDTPGLREIGVADSDSDADYKEIFEKINELASGCKFNDCKHQKEPNCAVREALASGDLDPEKFENFIKLSAEKARFRQNKAEKRRKDKKLTKYYKQVQDSKLRDD